MSKLIIVDWGTSNFRAVLLDSDLKQIDKISSNDGILKYKKDEFHPFLLNILSSWIDENSTIIMSGMIGSINGWIETNYISCSASLKDLSKNIKKIDGIKESIYIVPGVKKSNERYIEAMRGEETQVFGAMKIVKQKDAIVVLPGSHSKWVKVKNKQIKDFRTNMTGEVFNAILENTILRKTISNSEIDEKFYKHGISYSKNSGGLLSHVFQARTQANLLREENMYSFLSGIVIGHEIGEMLKVFKCDRVDIVGSIALNNLYKIGLREYGIKSTCIDSNDAVEKSIKQIYKQLKKVDNA